MLDSIVDCQTLATVPREEIVLRLGRFPAETMRRVDQALRDALFILSAQLCCRPLSLPRAVGDDVDGQLGPEGRRPAT